MIVRETSKAFCLHGESLPDVENYLKATERTWRSNASVSEMAKHSWDLAVGYHGATRLARDGWSEGARDLSQRLDVLPPNAIEAEWLWDVAGAQPDIGRFIAGDPEYMRQPGHPLGRKPTVQLVLNGSASCGVKANDIANYGCAIAALVDQIENNGRSVELDVTFAATMTGRRGLVGWKVKRAGEPMDLSAVAFSLGHPAAFRRLGFALYERLPSSMMNYSYGIPATLTEDDLELMDCEGAHFLQGIRTYAADTSSPEKALVYAAQQVNKAAGEELVVLG